MVILERNYEFVNVYIIYVSINKYFTKNKKNKFVNVFKQY